MIEINFPIIKDFQNKSKIVFNKPIMIANGSTLDTIELESGHLFTLYGNNGVGKTTFMNIISLLTNSKNTVSKKNGTIIIENDEMDNNGLSRTKVRLEELSFIFQDPHLINIYTLEENLQLVNKDFRFKEDFTVLSEKINTLEIDEFGRSFIVKKINKFINAKNDTPFYLSGGEKQLLSFVRSMIKPSNIIFADEPWASMDKHLKQFIESQIYLYLDNKDIFAPLRDRASKLREKKTVLVISHPVHHQNNTELYGIKNDSWTVQLPVSNDIYENADQMPKLTLEKYNPNHNGVKYL